jgi:hypothetical protein
VHQPLIFGDADAPDEREPRGGIVPVHGASPVIMTGKYPPAEPQGNRMWI